MDDHKNIAPPPALSAILEETRALGFGMASDMQTGALLRTLAASRAGGTLLELGTGTGMSAAWILDGMDPGSTLLSIDNNPVVSDIARRHLGGDLRVRFVVGDGASVLETLRGRLFDLIFADSWPGKYDHLDESLALLRPGALYVIDDMLPQPNWPDGHAAKADRLIETLEKRDDLIITKLNWSTGIILCARR